MNFQDFLAWAKLREPTMQEGEQWYMKQAYDFAVKYANLANPFLNNVKKEYIYSLTLHLIILTPIAENPLFLKYFPNKNGEADLRLKNFATYASSVSDSTSSVSSLAFAGLANMNVGDAMLLMTPYGAMVKTFNDSLRFSMVVV